MGKYILGNWKMNKVTSDIHTFCEAFNKLLSTDSKLSHLDTFIGIAPTFVGITPFKTHNKTQTKVMAQNVSFQSSGAFTSEVSCAMLKDIGVNYVIVGHSEVRSNLKETDEVINKKVLTLLNNKMVPVLCIGETLQEFEANQTMQILEKQLTIGLQNVHIANGNDLIIAYEPVWAIGTGKTATDEIIAKTHEGIKAILHKLLKHNNVPLLYGGSANDKNAKSILHIKNVDGVLVGGASLDPQKFYTMIQSTPEYNK